MSQEFSELCYERALIAHLIVHLTSRCVAPRGEVPEEDLMCEDLPFHSRRVPRESVFKMTRRLQSELERVERELSQFTMVKQVPQPLPPDPEEKNDEQQQQQSPQVEGKEKKRRTRKAG